MNFLYETEDTVFISEEGYGVLEAKGYEPLDVVRRLLDRFLQSVTAADAALTLLIYSRI